MLLIGIVVSDGRQQSGTLKLKLIFVAEATGNMLDRMECGQAEASMMLLGAVEANALALRRSTQWPLVEHPTFQLRGGHSTTELSSPMIHCKSIA